MQAPKDQMNKETAQQWDAPKANLVALKQIVTIRLDSDMLTWYKDAGPGYQTRINQVLRQHMAQEQGDSGGEPN